MEYNGKKYEVIFWDWLWTLAYHHKGSQKLYDWVLPFLSGNKGAKHVIVSWAADPEKRMETIDQVGIREYLEDVWTGKDAKRGFESGDEVKKKAFEHYIHVLDIDKEKVLVIGDSYEHEIPAAKELGLDWVHISDFLKKKGLV